MKTKKKKEKTRKKVERTTKGRGVRSECHLLEVVAYTSALRCCF
jgi:hypothetical protein